MKTAHFQKLSITVFFLTFILWVFSVSHQDATSMALHQNNLNSKLDKEFSGIAKVSDGDTIRIDEKRVRFIGIDAPETTQTCFDSNYNEYPCGKIAKEFLMNLANNKEVKCFYEKFDKYNRYLAQCYIEEKMINQEMIKNGMAVTYFFGAIDPEMARLEEAAQENKLGIWQGAFQLPKDYRKTHPRKSFNSPKQKASDSTALQSDNLQ